jgi:hypothetical protein
MLRFLVEKGREMNFVTLDDTLTALANCVSVHQDDTNESSEAPKVKAYFPNFYASGNGSINCSSLQQEEDTYRYSKAARILHQTLVKFPESQAMWLGRQSDQKLLQNVGVSSYGMAVLSHTMDWHHWETKRFVGNKFSVLNCKPVLDPRLEPISFNLTRGQYPHEPSSRPYKVGFNRAELIAFLDRNEIKYDLTLQDETELPIEDDIAVSQYDPSPINMKIIQYSIGEVNYSGLQKVEDKLASQDETKLPVEDDIAVSQCDAQPITVINVEKNSNGIDYSGLLKIPKKKDDWFEAIDAMTLAYREQYQTMPNATQAWGYLILTPPYGYNITFQEGCKNKDCLEMPGVRSLTKRSFCSRWERYTQ